MKQPTIRVQAQGGPVMRHTTTSHWRPHPSTNAMLLNRNA